MTLIDAIIPLMIWLQYPGMCLTLAGYFLIGSRTSVMREKGFWVGIVGNFIWILYAIWGNNPIAWGIVGTNLIISIVGIRGICNNREKISQEMIKYMKENDLLIDPTFKK